MPDPILQTAADEITAILKKHDIGGYVLLGSKTNTHFVRKLDPTWTCLTYEGEGVLRMRSKREDYPSKEAQGETMRLTVGLLQGLVDAGVRDMETLQDLLKRVGKINPYDHVSVVEKPAFAKTPSANPAETIMDSIIALCDAEAKSTQGDWRVRECGDGSGDHFVERPRQEGEPYGVQILGDEDYKDKRGDADFIVLAKKTALAFRKLLKL